jgi:mono/diheme cytochrome c family protein
MKMKPLHLLCFPLFLAACQPVPPAQPARSPLAAEGQALARSTCAACHSVGPYGVSPRSNAPAFPVIVNHEGLTAETLSTWLRGAHNYPSEMDFYLRDGDVDKLVAYMLTLRDPHYKRPPD